MSLPYCSHIVIAGVPVIERREKREKKGRRRGDKVDWVFDMSGPMFIL